jgi:hypothetical protein
LLANLRSKYDIRIEGPSGVLIKAPMRTNPVEAPK